MGRNNERPGMIQQLINHPHNPSWGEITSLAKIEKKEWVISQSLMGRNNNAELVRAFLNDKLTIPHGEK